MQLGTADMDTQDETSSTDSGLNVNNNNMVSGNVQNNNIPTENPCDNILPGSLFNNDMLPTETQNANLQLASTNYGILSENRERRLVRNRHNMLNEVPRNTLALQKGVSQNLLDQNQQDNLQTTEFNQLVIPDTKEIELLLSNDNSPESTGYELELPNKVKTGDVEKEKLVEERVKQLGLWHNKRLLERGLCEQLRQNIDEDGLFQAINRCKRKRPLRDRVDSASNEIINTIEPKLIKDDFGNNVSYKVDVIMGLFTHNVRHKIIDHTVVIQGNSPRNRHSKLHKEVTIEFPRNVDICLLQVGFNAGVFRCEAPFKMRNLNQLSKSFDSMSSAVSEETESVTSSDVKSVEGVL